jgi:hypothetical protein
MGGETQGGWGGSTVKRKRTPVFGISYSGPGPHETSALSNSLLRRRPLLLIWSWPPKSAEFVKNGAHYFLKTSYCAPFG